VLAHPLAMIGSDGFAIAAEKAQGSPHPRCYGCFPRVLGKYCRELKLFTLETAIHKMTMMPASQLGLPDRGVLREGAAADVVVFDFDHITDKATFEAPHQYPEGIDWVIVNGQIVVDHGQHTGARAGMVLGPQRG
jgi:N-acyl-D-aspartate/D-glutamate deacylase